MTQAELNILIRVQAAQAQAELAKVRAQLAALERKNAQAEANSRGGDYFSEISKSGSRLQWIGRQLMTNLTLPLGLAAGAAVKWGMENEQALARVGKLYGDASMSATVFQNEMKALDKVASSLSETFGVNKKLVLDIAGDWAAAGSSGLALAKSMGLTLRTMVIGEMDATEATEALIAIQAQWGASIDGTGESVDGLKDKTGGLVHIIEQLNAVENVTGTKLNDLVVAYSRASGVARTAGVSTGELAAMVSALTPAAGTASEAGTALKTMISRLLSPTKEAVSVMREMQLQVDEASWVGLTATERLKTLAEGFEGLTKPQKEVASTLIASRYHINKFDVLMREIQNPLGYFAKSMAVVNDEIAVHNIAQKELQTVLSTSTSKAKQAGNIIKNNLTDAFAPLIPVFVWLTQAVAKAFQAFTSINPHIQKLVIVVALALAALGPLIIMLGLMKLAVGQLAPMFIWLGKALLVPFAPLKLLYAGLLAPFQLMGAMMLRTAMLASALFASRASLAGASVAAYALRASMLAAWAGLTAIVRGLMLLGPAMSAIAPAMGVAGRAFAILPGLATIAMLNTQTAFVRGWAAVAAVTQGGAGITLAIQTGMHKAWAGITAAGMFLQRQIMVTSWVALAALQLRYKEVFFAIESARLAGMAALQRAWAVVSLAIEGGYSTAMLALQRAHHALMLSGMAAYNAGRVTLTTTYWTVASIITEAWQAIMFTKEQIWLRARYALHLAHYAGLTRAQAIWHAISTTAETVYQVTRTAIAAAYNKVILLAYYGWAAAMVAAQRLFGALWLVNFSKMWTTTLVLFRSGFTALLTNVRKMALMLVRVFVSPWGIALAAVIGLIVAFKDQIGQAFRNVIAYFRNLPQGVSQGLAPIGNILKSVYDWFANIFDGIGRLINRVFNLLPENIKNAMIQVMNVIRTAALKIYELFSYINPFAHHSPSLVENVTKGMDIVGDKFGSTAKIVKGHMLDMYGAMREFGDAAAGALLTEKQAQRGEKRAKVQQVAPEALPAYDRLESQVELLRSDTDAASDAIERQDKVVKGLTESLKRADKEIDAMNEHLDQLREVADKLSDSLDAAKAQYDRFADAQIMGLRAAEDALFDNEMAQKRLQLQIAKMGDTSPIEDMADAYKKLQGQIEDMSGRRSELRSKGAGSDILSGYDAMIADLQAQQDAISNGTNGAAAEINKLNEELKKLQAQAEIMDLEKALKFDPLNRQIEAFKNNVEEMPFGLIMAGLSSSKSEVDFYTQALDGANQAVKEQEDAIKSAQKARDSLSDTYDMENEKLQVMKDIYDDIEQSVRDGEQALNDLVTASDNAIQRAEEAARKAKEKKGEEDYVSPGLQNFRDAAAGDFEDPGAMFTVGREGGLGDQSGMMTDYAESLAQELGAGLADFDMFKPIKDAWNKAWQWMKDTFGPFMEPLKNLFSGLGQVIAEPFKAGEDGVSRFGQVLEQVGGWLSAIWGPIKTTATEFWNLFGDDIKTTIEATWDVLKKGWEDIWPPLKALFIELGPLIKALLPVIGLIVAAIVGSIQVVWSMFNQTIKPVFNMIIEVIRAVINFVRGLVQILTGAFSAMWGVLQTVWGILQTIIGAIKGIITGDFSMMKDGLSNIGNGILNIFSGLWDVLQGLWKSVTAIWDAIIGLFRGAIGIVVGIVKGFVQGIVDFFYWLWDVLVGHSIVPDMINAIIDWFLKLPGRILGMVWDFIQAVVKFFWELPGKIFDALGDLNDKLTLVVYMAFQRLKENLPGWIHDVVQFFLELPGKIWGFLKDKMPEVGKNIVEGLWNGIKGLGGWLKDKVVEWIEDHIPGPIKWALDIHSPSGVTEALGVNVGEGLEQGIESKGADVQKAAQDVANQVTNITLPAAPMGDVFAEFARSTGNAAEKLGILKDGLAAFRTETTTSQDVMQAVNDTMRDTPAALEGFNAAMINADGQINTTTESGSRMYSQMKDIQASFDGAGAAAFQSAIDQGMSMEEAARAAQEASTKVRDTFAQQALDAGMPKEAVDRLIQTYGLIPEDIFTKFNVDLDKADQDVKDFMEKDRTIRIDADIVARRLEVNKAAWDSMTAEQQRDSNNASIYSGGGVPKRADGGWISGPGGPRDDKILALLSNSEFVVNAKQAARYADILEAINAGTYDANAVLMAMPKFADGGALGELDKSINSAASTAGALASGATGVGGSMEEVTAEARAAWDSFVAYMTPSVATFTTTQEAQFLQMSTTIGATFKTMYADGQAQTVAFTTAVTTLLAQFSNGTIAQVTTMSTTVQTTVQTLSGQMITLFADLGKQLVTSVTNTQVSITDQFNLLSKNLTDTFNGGIKPVFDSFDPMLKDVVGWFTDTVESIGGVWSGINEKVAVPARFVVNEVYNNGIRGAWNKFNKFLDLPELEEHVARFATGGAVRGPGTGTSDSIPALLSNQEHVVTAREVAGAGGHREVERVRSMWASGKSIDDYIGRYALGGPVDTSLWNAAKAAFPNATLNSAFRPGHSGYHGKAQAVDLGGPMQEIADWIFKTYPNSAQLIWGPGPVIAEGNTDQAYARYYFRDDLAGHYDHVHWASSGPITSDGKMVSMAGGPGSMFDMVEYVRKGINESMDAVAGMDPKIGGGIGQWVPASIEKGRKQLLDKLVPMAEDYQKKAFSGNVGAGVEQWRKTVQQVLMDMALPLDWTDLTLAQMATESSGNPRAINLTDENATVRGTPSKGLMQVIDPTFADMYSIFGPKTGYPNDIWNPHSNIAAGLQWVVNRYGGPQGVWGNGHGYDQGGWLEPTPGGYGTYYNHTGEPEAVLTQSDWNAIYAAANNPVDKEMIEEGTTNALKNTLGSQALANVQAAVESGVVGATEDWKPIVYGVTETTAQAAAAQQKAAEAQGTASEKITQAAGEFKKYADGLTKLAVAIGTAATVEDPTERESFKNWIPTMNAAAELIGMLPDAKADSVPWAGYDVPKNFGMVLQEGFVNIGNIAKGVYQFGKDVAPTLLKYTASIGGAIGELMAQNGPVITAALAMLPVNPIGAAIMAMPVILQALTNLVPLIISAIADIVPMLFSAIKRFIQDFFFGGVPRYESYQAAQDAVVKNEANIKDNIANPGKWSGQNPTATNTGGNGPVTINVYGDLSMPNVNNYDGAETFVANLSSMAGK